MYGQYDSLMTVCGQEFDLNSSSLTCESGKIVIFLSTYCFFLPPIVSQRISHLQVLLARVITSLMSSCYGDKEESSNQSKHLLCREWLCLNLLRHVIVTEKQLIGCEIWGFKTVWWHDMKRSFTYSSKMFVKLQIIKYNERKLKHFEQ